MVWVLFEDKLFTVVHSFGDGWIMIREVNSNYQRTVKETEIEVVIRPDKDA
jgi:hypothetical protein